MSRRIGQRARIYGRPAYDSAGLGPMVAVDETNRSSSIRLTGRTGITAANDLYGSVQTTRYNAAGFVELPSWSPTTVAFKAQATPGAINRPDGYGRIAVEVDGALVATQLVPADALEYEYTAVGLGASSAKTVRIWGDFRGRDHSLNNGSDSPVFQCEVTGVRIPSYCTPPARRTATVGGIVHGDSLVLTNATQPWAWNSWGGQMRRAMHTAGGCVGFTGYGAWTACGDGQAYADLAAEWTSLFDAMGSTTRKLLIMTRPNDGAYYDFATVHTSPTTYATYMGNALDTAHAARTFARVDIVAPRIPQGTAQQGPNSGPYTYDAYHTALAGLTSGRAWLHLIDGTTMGLSTATDYAEASPNQVHLGGNGIASGAPGQSGHDKVFSVTRTAWGI